jgi:hypothetical protein
MKKSFFFNNIFISKQKENLINLEYIIKFNLKNQKKKYYLIFLFRN